MAIRTHSSSKATLFMYLLLGLFFLPFAFSIPFIVLHGINDSCTGVAEFTQQLANSSGTQGFCIEIGDGAGDSLVMPIKEQVENACEKVQGMKELNGGYNIVGMSQGNMVARGLIEFCDGGPLVKNYISLGGPHAGIASVPNCGDATQCSLVNYLLKLGVYKRYVQDIKGYLEGCEYLPKVNNEIDSNRNSTYKERFASLENLVLVQFQNDTILIPKETSWFGYYPDGSTDTILAANETLLYTEDWIGLKSLDAGGKVKYASVPGGHLAISDTLMDDYILPYLKDT